MKKIFKNPVENVDGSINCIEIHPVYGEIPHTQDPACEYELSEDLGPDDWEEIKPLPQAEKDAYAKQVHNESISMQIKELEAYQTKRRIRGALAGNQEDIDYLTGIENSISELRGEYRD